METEHYPQQLSFQKNGSYQNGSQPQSLPLIYAPQPYESDKEEVELGQLLAVLRRRARVVAGVTIAVTSAALLWALSRTPEYAGSFQLLVEPITANDKLSALPPVAQGAANVLGAGSLTRNIGLDYDTQIHVLQSPKLMTPIIEQLQARYPDLSYDSLMEDQKLAITRLGKTKIIEISYQDADPQKAQFVLDQISTSYIRYSLQERQTNLGQGVQFVNKQLPKLRQRVNTLQGQLQQFQERYNLVDPRVRGEQLAEQVNELELQRLDAQTKLGEAQTLSATLQKQLGLRPNDAVVASALSEAPRYQKFQEDLQEVEVKIAEASARYREDSPPLVELQDQRQSLLSLLDQEAQKVVGSNSSRTASQALAAQLPGESLRLQLTGKFVDAANEVRVLETRNQAINQAASRLTQKVDQLPAVARRYADLQRELKIASDTLNQLLVKREVLGVDAAQQDVPWELIAAPQMIHNTKGKPVPVQPKILLYLGAGAILGLVSGMVAALIAEKLSRVFHSPEEVKAKTELTPLSVIPIHPDIKQLFSSVRSGEQRFRLAEQHNAFAFSEAFATLTTQIRFLNSGKPIRSLVVSSATPGDGKSTVAVCLAQAAAQSGQRVLLVADLRHSQLQTWLNLSNSQGLATVTAADFDVHSVIQRSPQVSNLFILTSGQAPSNSAALLGSKQMQSLMQQLQAEFDLIIYDTPAILSSTDSSLLAPYVDGVIFVVRLDQTKRAQAIQALERLKAVHARVLGFVANGVKQSPPDFLFNGKQQADLTTNLN